MRAVSEANLLDMEPRPRSRGHGHHRNDRRSRSRSRLEHMESMDDEDDHAFTNMVMDNLMDTRAGRLGGGGKAISQLSVASR